jgi:UDP-3-O-[3-hydroxymyristoyl] N-acetylglucosamine deacetylase
MSSLRDRYSLTGAVPARVRTTIKAPISCVGKGLHSGLDVELRLVPAASGTGIVFHRTDLGVDVPARFDQVVDTRLCTVVAAGAARVGTIEHLMAALSALGVDDVRVEVNAPELPILDGSAAPFMFLISSAGIAAQAARCETLEVLRPVRVERDGAYAELAPHGPGARGFALTISIDFPAAAIGTQELALNLSAETFATALAPARTFTMAAEVAALQAAGLARGGSLKNAIVVDGANVLNPEGLRYADEFVRHKMLDAVGDLALAGAPIVGRFNGHCCGHALNNQLLRALFADQANYRISVPAPAMELSAA